MRLRNVKGSRETIADNDFCIKDYEGRKGKWNEVFGNDNPLMLEIGMGKGTFIMEMARRNPDINYIGIEKYSSVLVRALEKMEKEEDPPKNLFFIRMDIQNARQNSDRIQIIYRWIFLITVFLISEEYLFICEFDRMRKCSQRIFTPDIETTFRSWENHLLTKRYNRVVRE